MRQKAREQIAQDTTGAYCLYGRKKTIINLQITASLCSSMRGLHPTNETDGGGAVGTHDKQTDDEKTNIRNNCNMKRLGNGTFPTRKQQRNPAPTSR